MKYERKWNDLRNATGFAAACARLALPFYGGERRSGVVTAIEIAESYVNGEQISSTTARAGARAAIYSAYATDYAATDSTDADSAYAAARAAACAARAATDFTAAAIYIARAAIYASHAGVCDSELQIAFARWVVRDLSCDQLDEQIRQAAGAAIVAGDEELARKLVQGEIDV
ncbi:hypothetical protein LCGC14_1281360 [marine sediment metagenome]|uniref:Uncharacterized protein n=1 Tax=marine sediment metagenome TaxID=412755 RepID=A0A0F9NBM9_9ZZZZ